MKRIIMVLLSVLLSVQITTYAQSGHTAIGDTCALRTMLNEMFEYLEKDRVSSGLLRDYAVEMADLDKYSGTVLSDTNAVNLTTYERILRTLQSARVNTSISRISTEAIVDSMRNDCYYGHTIPVSISACKYHYISADALTNNEIGYDPVTNHVTDRYVSYSHWVNPYDSTTVLAFSPYLNISTFIAPTFQFKNNYNISNLPISQIEFNPGDGGGYRPVTIPGQILADYPDYGEYDMTLRITLSDNSVLLAHSPMLILEQNYATQTQGEPSSSPTPLDTSLTINTVYGTVQADVTVRTCSGHSPDSLVSPFIIVEGFELPENLHYALIDSCEHRSCDIDTVYNRLSNGLKAGFDIVYVNWYNAEADIRANAELLERIIEYVNRHKVVNGYSSVLMGQSMGGLVARYALCKMEQEHRLHNVTTFISHDSPHLGANVPLGAQFALDYFIEQINSTTFGNVFRDQIAGTSFGGISLTDDLFQELSDLLHNSMSVKQMLINHVDGNTIHDDWQNILNNIGFPQGDEGHTIKNICVSNAGNNNWITHGPLFNLSGKIKEGVLENIVWSFLEMLLSGFDINAILSAIFTTSRTLYGNVTINPFDGLGSHQDLLKVSIDMQKKFLWFETAWVTLYSYARPAPTDRIPMDDSYGSYYMLPIESLAQGNSLGEYFNLPSGEYSYTLADIFMFLPTVSSLCVNTYYPLSVSYYQYQNTSSHLSCEHTPFDVILLADTIEPSNGGRNEHIFLSPTISESIRSQIDTCLNGHIPEPTITGTTAPVNGSQYGISGESAMNVTWSSADSTIISINQSGVVQIHQNGITRIRAYVKYPHDQYLVEKEVIVGFPTFTLSGVQDQIFGRQDVYATSSWSSFPGHETELGVVYHWGRKKLGLNCPNTIEWRTSTSLHYSFYGGDCNSMVYFYVTVDNYTSPTYSKKFYKINPQYPQIDFPEGIVDPTGNIYMEGDNGTEILTVKAGSEEAEPIISISTAGIEDIYFDHIPSSAELMAVMLEKEAFKNMVKTMRPWGEEDYLIIPLTVNYLEYNETNDVPLILVYEED